MRTHSRCDSGAVALVFLPALLLQGAGSRTELGRDIGPLSIIRVDENPCSVPW